MMLGVPAGDDLGAGQSSDGGPSMVQVLCSQRDRFRQKAQQMEEQAVQVSMLAGFVMRPSACHLAGIFCDTLQLAWPHI